MGGRSTLAFGPRADAANTGEESVWRDGAGRDCDPQDCHGGVDLGGVEL